MPQENPPLLDKTMNTTEQTPRNLADVLASGLANIANNVKPDGSDISIDVPGMSANNVDDGFSELKQSLDTLVTASASGYGLSINFAKLGNVKMISIMGRPSEQLNAGTQYNLCDIPSGFARSTDVVGRAIANGQKAVTYYDVRGNLYLTPSDNLVTASTISFTIIYI